MAGPHPNSYFCLGLLSRFTAKHSAVLASRVEGGQLGVWPRVFCAAFRSPHGNLTLAVVNNAPAEFNLQLCLQGLSKSVRLSRYRYGEAERDRADVKVHPQRELTLDPAAAQLSDTLPPNSLTIYSTYQLEHDAPGVIVESAPARNRDRGPVFPYHFHDHSNTRRRDRGTLRRQKGGKIASTIASIPEVSRKRPKKAASKSSAGISDACTRGGERSKSQPRAGRSTCRTIEEKGKTMKKHSMIHCAAILCCVAVSAAISLADMMTDSPVTFPAKGALPSKYPPDVKTKREVAGEGLLDLRHAASGR